MTVTEPTSETLESTDAPAGSATAAQDELVEEDILVEEISIDGMCGVY